MLRALLVDDEPLARERLRALLAEAETAVEVVGEAGNGRDAVAQIHATAPDLVFLDVQMPVLSGFDVLDLLPPEGRPHVVFVTAYDAYALDAFAAHALDYLTKPVRLARLEASLRHVEALAGRGAPDPGVEALRTARAEAEPLRRLLVHAGRAQRIVAPGEVVRFEADDRLVFAHLDVGTRHMVDFTLKDLERRLPPGAFLRIHRAHLVALDAIREIVPWGADAVRLRLADGTTLPVARRRTADVKAALGA